MRLWGAILAALAIATVALAANGSPAAAAPQATAARDYDCADFSSQAEAQEYLLPGDPYGLDADNDGIACESNPCPCTGEGDGGGNGSQGNSGVIPPPPPPPYHLPKAAARHAAVVVAKKFVSRNARVTQVAIGVCRQLAERRVDCFGTATGRSASSKTSCQLRVAVRAPDRHPKARLVSTHCRTRSTARLTAPRALQAFRTRGAELAAKPTGIFQLERLTALSFRSLAEWVRRTETKPPVSEECFALMEATRMSNGEVTVTVIETACEPIAVQ